jgi:hypothetical protein
MTPEEYKAKIENLAAVYASKAIDQAVIPAANELLATIKNRIVQQGKNSQGAGIGQYDTTPAYYGPNAFIKKTSFTPQGKTGEKVFKNGKPHKTEYIPSGYKGLRDKQGRPTDKMNMSYSGSTLLAYQMDRNGDSVVIGLTNKEASDIRKGQEKKRGKIFYAMQTEMDDYSKNVTEESERITRELLK